jgi:hypothetical protein
MKIVYSYRFEYKTTRSFDKSRILPADSKTHAGPGRGLWKNPAFVNKDFSEGPRDLSAHAQNLC